MASPGHHQLRSNHQRSHRDSWLLNLAKGIAAVLVAVKFFFLHDHHPAYKYHSGRLPFRERYDTIETSLRLKFRDDRPSQNSTIASFKILQLTDIHLGEATFTDWGPEQDRKSLLVLDSVIPAEKPDLIVLSGDQLTANNVGQKNATSYYSLLGNHLSKYGIPWCLIFGNHDDAPFEFRLANGTLIKTPAKTSRAELLAVDRQFPLSLTQPGPKDVFGSSNYVLTVQLPSTWWNHSIAERQSSEPVALQLIFLDSGGGALPMQLERNQIDWFRKEHRANIPGVAVFQHVPSKDFAYDGTVCQGLHDDPVDSIIQQDPGIIDVLQKAENVLWLGVGHDHGNDFCCPTTTNSSSSNNNTDAHSTSSLHLCFGRHSGYGGYGKWDRGARIYEVELKRLTALSEKTATSWKSWVRMESGDVVDHYHV